jgi:co-chaperonin GroES (HSP10)
MNNGGDVLARGARTAQFPAGGSAVDDEVVLHNVAEEDAQDLASGIKVLDRRSRFDSEPVKKAEPKYPEKAYEPFKPILDRVLIKRISEDKNMEMMEDGSMRDKRTGFIIPAKYRQHSNVGVVLAVGDFVVMGGVKTDMLDVVKPGYRVLFGEYNAEKLKVPDEQVQAMCDAISVEFEASEDLDVVRVQDIRGIYRPKENLCKTQS